MQRGFLPVCSSFKALLVTCAFGLLLSTSITLLLSPEVPPEFSVTGLLLKSGVGGFPP